MPPRHADDDEAEPAREHGDRRAATIVGVLALVAALAFVCWARIHLTLTDVNFTAESADGLLRSDPGLVYYLTERIIDGGGLPPADFRSDPRVTWPDPADLPAMFTVGQEFLVAWAWRLFEPDVPLHVFCVIVMSVVASLGALGVFGLARELTRSTLWGGLAALLWASLLYTYRTLGVILIREDLSLPLFAVHLWLLARAARVRTTWSFVLAGLAAAAALATWHAMAFVVTLEALVFLAWFLRSGETPFAVRRAWIVPAVVALACFAVPVLWAKGFVLSPAMAIAAALAVTAFAAPAAQADAPALAWRRRAVGGAALVVLLVLGRVLGSGDYGHVTSFLFAKLAHLGRLPQDPSELDFGARLLWQGPFATAGATEIVRGIGVGLAFLAWALVVAVPGWLRGKGDRTLLLFVGFAALSTVSGWLVVRTLVLLCVVTPVLAAVLLARLPAPRVALGVMAACILGQTAFLVHVASSMNGSYVRWYAELPDRNIELARLVRWARDNLPADAPILSDYVTSTALLAHNGNPIVIQPKYETLDSRRRIEEFTQAYTRGTPADLRAMAERYRCELVVVDRIDAWWLHGYLGGYPLAMVNGGPPPAGTAAGVFGSADDAVVAGVPGLRLVYRAPPRFRWDFFRVYAVE